jgi:hypothetical protein
MRLIVTYAVFLGISLSTITLITFKGGHQMPTEQKEMIARAELPAVDSQPTGAFETATFALG